MRNALFILVIAGLLSVAHANVAPAADVPISSVYAIPVANQSESADAPGLLPTADDGEQHSPLVSQTAPQSAPQASIVEAIPTPTAFQAGVFLLLLIMVVRGLRKFRWA